MIARAEAMPDQVRFAIYHAPAAGTALHEAGSRWLGRDAIRDCDLTQPEVDGLSPERLSALTRAPRSYGLHATLKAPFALRSGLEYEDLLAAAARLSAEQASFGIRIALGRPDGFFALVEDRPDGQADRLAAVMVRELDSFRAPPGQVELDRRRCTSLSARQEDMLRRWGYPYVMDEFRFHITLTQPVDDDAEAGRLNAALCRQFGAVVGHEHAIDAIALFRQDRRDLPFRQVARLPFGRTG